MKCARCGRTLRSEKSKDAELCYECRKTFAFAIRRDAIDERYDVLGWDYDCSCNTCAAYHGGHTDLKPYHPNQKYNVVYLSIGDKEIEKPVVVYD